MESQTQQTFDFDMTYIQNCLWNLRPKPVRNFCAALVCVAIVDPLKHEVVGPDDDSCCMIKASFDNLFGFMNQFAGIGESTMQNARRAAVKSGLVEQTRDGNRPSLWTFRLADMLPRDAVEMVAQLLDDPRTALQIAPCNFENCRVQKPKLHPAICTAETPAERGAETPATLERLIDHEHEERMNDRRRFFSISRSDVLKVAGYGECSAAESLEIFDEYFADACLAKDASGRHIAESSERWSMLALFRMVARKHRLPRHFDNGRENTERVQSCGPYLRSCWENRFDEDGIELTDGDRRYAHQLLNADDERRDEETANQPSAEFQAAVAATVAELEGLSGRDIAERLSNEFMAKRFRQPGWNPTPQALDSAARQILRDEAKVSS